MVIISKSRAQKPITIFAPKLSLKGGKQAGGGERVLVNLVRGLNEHGVPLHLVLFRAGGDYLSQIPSGVRVIDLGSHRNLFSFINIAFNVFPKFVRYLREEKPATVLSFDNRATLIAIFAKSISRTRIPIVASIHNTLSYRWASSGLLTRIFAPWLLRMFYYKAYKIVGVSQGVADDLKKLAKLPQDKVQVIYNPVITPELFEKALEPVNHPWFGCTKAPVILGVGRLTKQKDFATLVRAFNLVREKREARLVILGEGEERSHLEALVRKLGLETEVDLPGFVDNPYAYMQRADVFVLSSAWEGLPTVLIEALALGIPVVTTDCPSGPAEILDDGRWGDLVSVGDIEAMAEAILQALDHPKRELPKEAWEQYTLDKCAENYVKVLFDKANS